MADEHDDDFDLDDDTAAKFEAWFTKRTEEEERKKNRAKPPKDFGEAIDRIADAVLDRAEQRAAERRRKEAEADEAPTRGGKPSTFARIMGYGGEERDAG